MKTGGKLWGDDSGLDPVAEKFTVGDDPARDMVLVPYDCRASIAHAHMLGRIKVLDAHEVTDLVGELEHIIDLHARGEFTIGTSQEDCHTAIEQHLAAALGDTGKKIHTGRSRNDQVLAALRLYYRDALAGCDAGLRTLVKAIRTFSRRWGRTRMPGFTHTRKAMPSSVRMWAGALADSLKDGSLLLRTAAHLLDQCPLGTGAGYGVPLPLDRQGVARELGFARVQRNPVYVQNSRGKFEAFMLHVLSQIMLDLNRAASDLILFSMPELGFFVLPPDLCTGSSIMPQKKNPDVLELLRARYHHLLSLQLRLQTLPAGLIQGYHRDLQATKAPTMEGLEASLEALDVATLVFEKLRVDAKRCRDAMTPDLFAAERAMRLVLSGVPFRDAYARVKEELDNEQPSPPSPPDAA